MVGRIAHEIRNPLGSVELFASMLRKDLRDDPERRRYAEHIGMAVEAMDRLLANLLVCTKPNCPRPAWHPAGQLIRDALTMTGHATAREGLAIRLQRDPAVSDLYCDEAQLKQVLVNLILNGTQAMPGDGTLTIGITGDRDALTGRPAVRLSVSDTGVGIEPEHRSRLFDPFFTTKEVGTGLGLAIVHAIVEGHHGRVEVESEPGRGTTFTINLPQPAKESAEWSDER